MCAIAQDRETIQIQFFFQINPRAPDPWQTVCLCYPYTWLGQRAPVRSVAAVVKRGFDDHSI
jgi:hypothetical protein